MQQPTSPGDGLRGLAKWQAELAVNGLLLRAIDAARFLGISKSEFYRLDTTGQLPSPVRFGKVKRWSRTILERWAAAGCPARHDFERQR